jgi:acetylornithine deacetylase/succinyl-diaminopimelate desuccinylase-like protein
MAAVHPARRLAAARRAADRGSRGRAGPGGQGCRTVQHRNFLAGLGIPATAGFGVDYKGLHGTDERVRLNSIPAVQAAYHQALLILLHGT